MKPKGILLGYPMDRMTMKEALEDAVAAIGDCRPTNIAFINAGKLAAMDDDPALKDAVLKADRIYADGVPVIWASRMLNIFLPERVAGVDLMFRLLKLAGEKRYKVYMFGATEDVLGKAAEEAEARFPGIRIVGRRNGYFKPSEEETIADGIAASGADILFVGISSPMKELFLAKYKERMGVPVMVGVGGSFDILAGTVKRAPLWMQRAGLEWFYRLTQEPGRMWKRYLVGNSRFIWKVFRALLKSPTEANRS